MNELRTSVKLLNIDDARRYLRAVQSAADEGARSSDPRVVMLCLRVLELQSVEIRRRFRDIQACAA
jgi:hypothetical protein